MPWSPIKKFPGVLERLRLWGYEKEVPISELKKALMLETGIIKAETLGRYIRVMEELGYIQRKNDRIVLINNANGGM